jgi:hypothetical protein
MLVLVIGLSISPPDMGSVSEYDSFVVPLEEIRRLGKSAGRDFELSDYANWVPVGRTTLQKSKRNVGSIMLEACQFTFKLHGFFCVH